MSVPEELRYTEEHEWIALGTGGSVRVGITDHAQDQLGDVVFVDLPEAGTRVAAGAAVGEIESTKSVSELYAPVDGEVLAVNSAVTDTPELLNSDPYGEGWLLEIQLHDSAGVEGLLDAGAYGKLVQG